MGSSACFVHRYMDRVSVCLHDALLSKMANSFFACLPTTNPMAFNSTSSASRRRDYAREVNEKVDYYCTTEYSTASLNCCHKALREVLSASYTAERNLRRHKSDISLHEFPDAPPNQVSLFFRFLGS